MENAEQLALRIREVLLDGQWVAGTNFKQEIEHLDLKKANASFEGLNSIAALSFHVHYYVAGLLRVLNGGPLDIRDQYSFDMPTLEKEEDWQQLIKSFTTDAELLAAKVATLSKAELLADFADSKYGNYHRNINVLIEHSYYHLGQLLIIKKLLRL